MKKYFRTIFLFVSCIVFWGCAGLPIINKTVDGADKRVNFLVLHHRKSNPVDTQPVTNLRSAHYILPESDEKHFNDDNLGIFQFVDEDNVAQQTQHSYWQGQTHLDNVSIGIEVVNAPDCKPSQTHVEQVVSDKICFYPDFSPSQVELLTALIKDILQRNPAIGPTQIVGHSDISTSLSSEPGPRFPWQQLYRQGIGAWYDNKTVEKYWQLFKQHKPHISLVQKALASYGYNIIETGILDSQSQRFIRAFQAHFIPWQVTGNVDQKTTAIIFALIEKYFPSQSSLLLKRYYAEHTRLVDTKPIKTARGQIDRSFPDKNRSSREFINDRALFKTYKGRGEIIIENLDAISADIYINGHKLNIAKPMRPNKTYQYSLKKRTKNGTNTLHVTNVLPKGSIINIVIPYPIIDANSKDLKFDFSAVDKQINDDVKNGFPGAVLMVLKNGKVIKHTAYGFSQKFANEGKMLLKPIPMQTDTLFDLASNTKMFATNFALMKLVSEGKLNVSLPIHHYLPDYQGANRETRLVNDLLTHQAGYGDEVQFFNRENKGDNHLFSQNKQRTEQLILQKVPFRHGRKVKQVYSDTDYMLLGMLIERITGKALDNYVEQDIYAALKLKHTQFNPLKKGYDQSTIAATEIHGNTRDGRVHFDNIRNYVIQGEVHDEKAFYSFDGVAGHAGLFSTTADLAVLMQVLLNGGGFDNIKVFDAQTLEQFIKPTSSNASFGLGWRRASYGNLKWHFGPYASPSAYGHTGWTGTVTVIDPDHDLAIALLTNTRHSKIDKNKQSVNFKGKRFETGNYGSIISLVYEAILNQ